MVVFWDSSALIHLLCDQGQTTTAESFLVEHSTFVAWWGSFAECATALSRLEREGNLSELAANQGRERLSAIRKLWVEVLPSETLLQMVVRLGRVHAVRTADAFQLAAALIAQGDRVEPIGFLSFDVQLRRFANREGMRVLEGFEKR